MDPYLLITYNAQTKKTTVANGQGKTPVWNNIFCFEWNPISPFVLVKSFDEDTASDDFIGE